MTSPNPMSYAPIPGMEAVKGFRPAGDPWPPEKKMPWIWEGLIPGGDCLTTMIGPVDVGRMAIHLLLAKAFRDKQRSLGGAALTAGHRLLILNFNRTHAHLLSLASNVGAAVSVSGKPGYISICFSSLGHGRPASSDLITEDQASWRSLWNQLRDARKLYPDRLMVACNLRHCFPAHYSDREGVLAVMDYCRRLGGPWVFCDHTRFSNSKRHLVQPLGNSLWTTLADRVVTLERWSGGIEVRGIGAGHRTVTAQVETPWLKDPMDYLGHNFR